MNNELIIYAKFLYAILIYCLICKNINQGVSGKHKNCEKTEGVWGALQSQVGLWIIGSSCFAKLEIAGQIVARTGCITIIGGPDNSNILYNYPPSSRALRSQIWLRTTMFSGRRCP